MKVGIVIAAFAAAVGCVGGDEAIQTTFDPCEPLVLEVDGNDDAKASAAEAIKLWQRTAGAKVTLEDVADAPRIPVKMDTAGAAFHGFYDDEEAVIWINKDLDDDERTITMAHEVGHAFGLRHVDEVQRRSVMNKGNLETGPQRSDRDELVEMWGECE